MFGDTMFRDTMTDRILGWQNSDGNIQLLLLRAFCDGIRPRSVVLNVATLLLLSLFFSPAVHMIEFLAWCAGIAAFGVVNRIMAARVSRQIENIRSPRTEALWFVLMGAFYGLLWGAGGSWFFWQGEPFDQGILLFVIVFSAVIGPYAPIPGFTRIRFVATAIPFVGSFAWQGEMAGFLVTGLLAVWLYLRFSYLQRYQNLLASQYRLQAELASRGEELQHANEAKDDFLASMSHELRTPLNGVLGMARLLQREDLPAEDRKRAGLIEQSGQTLLNLLNGILETVRVPLEAREALSVRFSLRDILEEITVTMSARAAGLQGVEVTMTIDDVVPDGLTGDAAKLRHVIYNLVSNAIDFANGRPVEIQVQSVEQDADNVRLRFSVRDHGVGIAPPDQAKIFERFSQLQNQPAGRVGTGLGLAIARDLVDTLGGSLELTSAENEGSEFHFTLGFAVARADHLNDTSSDTPLPEVRPLSVLLVEDMEINQIVARAFLENAGHKVTVASTGKTAIELVKLSEFDAVLLDIRLPDMSGTEVADMIRAQQGRTSPRVPVIALTANASVEDGARYTAAGIDQVLTKPLNPDALAHCLAQLTGRAPEDPSLVSLADLALIRRNVNDQTLAKMITLFEQEWQTLLPALHKSFTSGDFNMLETTAHKAAGMSASLALGALRLHCLDLETAAATRDSDRIKQLLDKSPDLARWSLSELTETMVPQGGMDTAID
jgi:signal transduction histidine kinase/DNA-binding response OmpR family regulator